MKKDIDRTCLRSRGFKNGPDFYWSPEVVCEETSQYELKSGGCPRKAKPSGSEQCGPRL